MPRVVSVLVLLAATGLLAGCPSVEQDPPVTQSASTIAIFAPNSDDPCLGVMPFPTDLVRDPDTGTLNLPFCRDDDADTIAIKRGLRTLNGYSVKIGLTINFSAPIDTTTLADGILVLNATTKQPHQVAPIFIGAQNMLAMVPVTPFDEETTYIVALSSAIKDSVGAEIVSDQAFTFLKSTEPLVDAAGYSRFAALDDATANGLEPIRAGYEVLWAALAQAGLERDEVLIAYSFTTQTVTKSFPQLATLLAAWGGAEVQYENTLAAVDHPLLTAAGVPTTNVCKIHTGRVMVKSLLTDTGTFGVDRTGSPIVTDAPVDYVLFTPNPDPDGPGGPLTNSGDCSGANPDLWNYDNLLVVAHSLGKCKNVAVTLANTFGMVNYAVLALDGPRAGSRTLGNLGDQDLDTCPDQPATPELITLGDANPNPFVIRDHLRQWGLELVQAIDVAQTDARVYAGADTSTPAPSTGVALYGHSWGGIAAALAGSVSEVDAVALSAASGDMTGIFTPLLQAGIAARLQAAGLSPGSPEFNAQLTSATQETAGIYQWALDPADPLFYAAGYPLFADRPVLVQVVSAGSTMTDAPLHATATQRALAAAFAAKGNPAVAATTFTLECNNGGTFQPVCDDNTGVVGAPLQPCAGGGPGDPDFTYTAAMQTQLVTFVLTGGLVVTSVPATPNCN